MDEENYYQAALDLISDLENRSRDDSLQSFYEGLQVAVKTLQERLNTAAFEGIDL